jgi:hypothetical protein
MALLIEMVVDLGVNRISAASSGFEGAPWRAPIVETADANSPRECSAHDRPPFQSALPISFIAAEQARSPSVTIFRVRPYVFMMRFRPKSQMGFCSGSCAETYALSPVVLEHDNVVYHSQDD